MQLCGAAHSHMPEVKGSGNLSLGMFVSGDGHLISRHQGRQTHRVLIQPLSLQIYATRKALGDCHATEELTMSLVFLTSVSFNSLFIPLKVS